MFAVPRTPFAALHGLDRNRVTCGFFTLILASTLHSCVRGALRHQLGQPELGWVAGREIMALSASSSREISEVADGALIKRCKATRETRRRATKVRSYARVLARAVRVFGSVSAV